MGRVRAVPCMDEVEPEAEDCRQLCRLQAADRPPLQTSKVQCPEELTGKGLQVADAASTQEERRWHVCNAPPG